MSSCCGVAHVVAVDLIRERLTAAHEDAVDVVAVVDALAPGQELSAAHGRGGPAQQRERVEGAKRGEGQRAVEPGIGRDGQGEPAEERVRVGLRDDREAGVVDDLAGVELELEPGTRSLLAEEGLERRGDVQRVREVALQLAVTLDAADHRGVEADARVEQERTAVRAADADAFRRAACQ